MPTQFCYTTKKQWQKHSNVHKRVVVSCFHNGAYLSPTEDTEQKLILKTDCGEVISSQSTNDFVGDTVAAADNSNLSGSSEKSNPLSSLKG